MNPYYQYGHNGSIYTEYHSPFLPHPHIMGAHVGGTHPSFPTKSGSAVVNPSSADCEEQAVKPCTPHRYTKCQRQNWRRKMKKEERAAKLAGTNYSRNQLPVGNRPQECVHPNVTITSTTSSVRVETYSSASKVVNQTSVVASAIMSSEHPQSRDDKSPRNQQENAQTPSVEPPLLMARTGPDMQDESTVPNRHGGTSTISLAIRRNDCLGMELNPGDIEKIQMGLHKMIDDHSNDNFSPHFEDYSIQTDALIVHCANEENVQWLRRVFDNNGKVFAGLRLVRASVLLKVRVAFKTKDVLTSDPVVFLKRLQCQNFNLQTRHWMTEERPTIELDLQTKQLLHRWVFRIDQGSANAIKATNMTAYTGLCKGTFEFLPDVEPPKEIVIKQEAESLSS